MSIRTSLIKWYLQDEQVYEVIGHDLIVFVRIFVLYLLLLWAVFGVWFLLAQTPLPQTSIYRISLWLWVIIYIKWTLDLLDKYLDALLVTNVWLILFERDGLFKQTATNIQRVSLETVMYEQSSFWDTILKKGDIKLFVEDMTYSFKEVHQPSKKVTRVISRKEKILGRYHYTENETDPTEPDKYEVLVEALGEVVSEYVDKKRGLMQ